MSEAKEGGATSAIFGRTFYIAAGIAYIITAPLLAFFAMMTPMACASGRCVETYVNIMFFWTAIGAVVALAFGILAFARSRRRTPRLSWMLIGFPFAFWAIYWAFGRAAGVL